MSFLGVGAPEALLVGVVALVVFGPKGLADVSGAGHGAVAGSSMPGLRASLATRCRLQGKQPDASAGMRPPARARTLVTCTRTCAPQAAKSVGKTLRAFQPTIREVVEASQDIKGTLEKVRT